MVDIIMSIADQLTQPDSEANMAKNFRELIPTCVKYSLLIQNHNDTLASHLYEQFCDYPTAKVIFLESLHECITSGMLRTLSPIICKDLVELFAERKKFSDIQQMIVNLDISCLDIHQAMTLCRQNNLHDALIYIQNQAFDDYVIPMKDLFNVITHRVLNREKLTESDIEAGNKLFVYISFCLTGRQYPLGELSVDKKKKIRADVCHIITERSSPETYKLNVTYPYLRTLTYFDTKEFLNVLAMAFDDPNYEDEEW